MGDTFSVTVGEKGRIVVPASVRSRQGWRTGTPLIAIEEAEGVVLVSRDHALALIRQQLSGSSLVDALIADRRRAAAEEDAP